MRVLRKDVAAQGCAPARTTRMPEANQEVGVEHETIGLIRDRLESIDDHLAKLSHSLEQHVDKDSRYWQQIDQQNAQISLLKWMFSGAILAGFTSAGSWLATKFGLK
jgi:hypothetical protein